MRARVAELKSQRDAGRYRQGLADAHLEAAVLGHRPLMAEALHLAGQLATDIGGFTVAARWLEQAVHGQE